MGRLAIIGLALVALCLPGCGPSRPDDIDSALVGDAGALERYVEARIALSRRLSRVSAAYLCDLMPVAHARELSAKVQDYATWRDAFCDKLYRSNGFNGRGD